MANKQPTEKDWDEIHAFKPPKVDPLDMVYVYRGGDVVQSPLWGIVVSTKDKTVKVRLMDTQEWLRITDEMRHVDDPWIKWNERIKQYGTWAIHPVTKAKQDRIEGLESRIRDLEKAEKKVEQHKHKSFAKVEA